MIYFFEYSRHILKQKIGVSDKIVMIKNFALIQLKFHVKRIRLKLKKHKKLKLVSEVSKLNCGKTLLYKKIDRLNIIEKPNIFRSDKNLSILKGKSPNIEVWFLNTCKVISRTSSLVYNNCIYNNYLSKMEILHDLKNPLGQNINSITKKNVSLSISKYLEKKDEYIYIHLLNEHSHNYYHFMFETLPKFIVICEYLKNNDKDNNLPYILLLDENIPYQFLEVIDYFATIKYDIEFVPKYCMIECKNLIFCTDFWNSLDNTRFPSSIVNEFFVDRFAIETIKNKLNLKTTIPYRKIYLQRKSKQARYLSNTNEIGRVIKIIKF